MEKLLSTATRLIVVGALILGGMLIIGVPMIITLLSDTSLPQKYQLDTLPLSIQIPLGILVLLYFVFEIRWWRSQSAEKSTAAAEEEDVFAFARIA